MAEVWQSSITDSAGNVIPRAVVQVRDEATDQLAEIFEDVEGETPKRNPFFADDVGFARFYAEPGLYRIRAQRGAQQRVYENVLLGTATADYYVWQHHVADAEGNSLAMASVEIRDADTNALATLYADEAGAVSLGNPFTADSDGVARCYTAAGVYKITVSRGVTFEQVYEHVVIGPFPTRDLYAWQSTVVDETGAIQPGASILVTEADSSAGDPATIYADENETPLANPFTSDAQGFARFYAAAGVYDIRVRGHCEQRILKDVRIGGEPPPMFVALPSGTADSTPHGIYSLDGKTWTAFAIPEGREWSGIAYSPALHLWVAVGFAPVNQGSVMSSSDGINWTLGTISALTGGWRGVVWVEDIGLFVAGGVGGASGSNTIATSPDGIDWTVRNTTAHVRVQSLRYGLGRLIACGAGKIWSSNDFSTWVWSEVFDASGNNLRGGCFTEEPALYVQQTHSSTSVLRSTDGVNFFAYASFPDYNNARQLAADDDCSAMVASVSDGDIYSADDIPPTSWTEVYDPGLAEHPHVLEWLPSVQIFAYLGVETGAWSTDGINWTEISIAVSGNWQAFGRGNV